MKRHFFSSSRVGLFSIFFAIVLTIFSIWLPFGFSLAGLIEEWGVLGLFVRDHLFFVVTPHSLINIHAVRPLTIFPHALAYFMDPNSFNAWHCLLMLSLLLKGLSCAYLIWFLLRSRAWALLGGVLMIIYPADTMQLSFRSLHINWAVSCFLLASAGWLHAFSNENNWKSRMLSALSSLMYLISLFLYEAVLPLFLFPLFIFWAREGFQATIQNGKQKKSHVMNWVLILLFWLAYEAWVSPQIQSYQAGFKNEWASDFIFQIPKYVWLGLWRGFFTAWVDAFRILIHEFSLWGYAYLFLFSGILFSIFSFCFLIENKISLKKNAQSIASPKRLFLLGLLILFLGFSTFLFAPSHVAITQRTYLCASIGGVLAWVGIGRGIYARFSTVAHTIAFLFLMAGLSQQLFQFQQYIQISNRERDALRQMIDQLDIHTKTKKLLIIDESEQLNQVWFFLLPNLQAALQYVYDHRMLPVEICYPSFGLWSHSENRIDGYCDKKGGDWIFKDANQKTQSIIPEKNLQVIKLKAENPMENTDETNLNILGKIKSNHSDFKQKYKNILIHPAWQDRFQWLWRSHLNAYRWTAGDYWSLSAPIRGMNWSEPAWKDYYGLFPKSYILMSGKQATLQFYFIPKMGSAYYLKGYAMTPHKAQFKTSISLNGYPLSVSWKNPYWRANISEKVLKRGWNQLAFSNDQAEKDYFFAMSEFEVLPLIH